MAETKIIWSRTAKKKLYAILESPIRKTKSKAASIALYKSMAKEIKLLLKQPEKGQPTTENEIKGLIINDCLILFEIKEEVIIIYTIII
jgi:plasmid stabilization system protein ParE